MCDCQTLRNLVMSVSYIPNSANLKEEYNHSLHDKRCNILN